MKFLTRFKPGDVIYVFYNGSFYKTSVGFVSLYAYSVNESEQKSNVFFSLSDEKDEKGSSVSLASLESEYVFKTLDELKLYHPMLAKDSKVKTDFDDYLEYETKYNFGDRLFYADGKKIMESSPTAISLSIYDNLSWTGKEIRYKLDASQSKMYNECEIFKTKDELIEYLAANVKTILP